MMKLENESSPGWMILAVGCQSTFYLANAAIPRRRTLLPARRPATKSNALSDEVEERERTCRKRVIA